MVVGLGSRVAARLTGDGWTNVSVGNYLGMTLNRPTVFYGANSAREKAAADSLAIAVGGIVEPRPANLDPDIVFVVLTGT